MPKKYDNLLKNASGNIFIEALVIKEVKYDWNEKSNTIRMRKGKLWKRKDTMRK